ncbi:MAG: class I SAM-dependent methyltransferase [Chloroflexi bacterium]|nr:class I SAM-dependent methyltransferase [Chloroflexota bacterium]MBI5705037.1 class I SAM-dependent methyltransferase [Chloroflexota bacterium]HRJ58761.1 class I SAM-dependent methyltransferase [Anaerolineales bacterium]HRK89170.1 class I SAM-dependent methyltransferase [Anaerolineales bacterium]
MKTRESGMPNEQMWDNFFDPDAILDQLNVCKLTGTIVDLGCGYGTFTIPAARKNSGTIYALDIEGEMIQAVQEKANEAGVKNVFPVQRDFMVEGIGLPDNSCEYVMLFNLLHAEEPLKILMEAMRVLVPGGKTGVIHWNYDPTTPRGPSLDIRPRPEQCQEWIMLAGFELIVPHLDFPPFHYGMVGQKP